MKNCVYRSPECIETKNPDKKFLREIFFEKGKEYWNIQSGDAGIHILDDIKGEMVLIYSEPYGFYIQHFNDGEDDEYVVMHDEDLANKVTVYPGGEPWNLPVSFFCSPSEAFEIVEHIMESGQRTENKKWVKLWDGHWSE